VPNGGGDYQRLPIAPVGRDCFIACLILRQGRGRGVLVLTRKSNQSIMIGDDIEISVLAVMGEKVRIGIEAPRSVPVFRREVYVEIQEDRKDENSRFSRPASPASQT
jgi:carbon storage regulator